MAYTQYMTQKFSPAKQEMIRKANLICEEYAEQGMVLTLRQLYYQFVARGWIANKQSEYKRLGDICQDARMAGEMDWDHLIDRTRNLQSFALWESPEDAIKKAAERYNRDVWAPQHQRIEVWIEKDAAIGVIEGVCTENNVPFFSCRGYTSVSEMHSAAQRLRWHIEHGSAVTILHIGDHDPSGLDMTRDITDRLWMFMTVDWRGLHDDALLARSRGDIKRSMRAAMREKGSSIGDHQSPFTVKRIALNRDQIEEYAPPPNPVKKTDSRYRQYAAETGMEESYELDALDPAVLSDLVDEEINSLRDETEWAAAQRQLEEERQALTNVATWWESVDAHVKTKIAVR